MKHQKTSLDAMGWSVVNSYRTLPARCYVETQPAALDAPSLILKNTALARDLSLDWTDYDDTDLAHLFTGQLIPDKAIVLSQAYAGHQFGNFTMLGDGRAHLLCEHMLNTGQTVDLQLKGSGRTPFSRRGDGKAALGPMLREYIISEAMHALNVPTTRSLGVAATGEPVFRHSMETGAVLARVAASHIRVGTFQFLSAQGDHDSLKQLADYSIQRHYPNCAESEQPYLNFINSVMQSQIDLIVNWMRVGFIHGVMNTDNMTISGETIDYGPCAFIDVYNPETVFSSIDRTGRYAFENQGPIAQWNLARFAETLLPILDTDPNTALKQAETLIYSFPERFDRAWVDMMRKKLGLLGQETEDKALARDFLSLLNQQELDYTNTFRTLATANSLEEVLRPTPQAKTWWQHWKTRQPLHSDTNQSPQDLMHAHNPSLIPRNHKVEDALEQAEKNGNLAPLQYLLEGLKTPYANNAAYTDLKTLPNPSERVYETFCGT